MTASCLLAVALSTSASGSDWPTYLHDNNRSGGTPDKIAVPLQPAWQFTSIRAPDSGWSKEEGRVFEGQRIVERTKFDDALHVAVSAGRVYFGSSVDHQLRCLDAETGRELWTFFTGGPIRLAPTVWRNRVVFGSDDGVVYCLDATTGQRLWDRRGGPANEQILARGEMASRWPIRTGLIVEEGTAYIGAGIFPHEDVFLHAVNVEDGKTVWTRDNISQTQAYRDDLSPQGYLLANGDLLVIPSGRSLPLALNRGSGEILFKPELSRNEAGGVVGGTRALLADEQIFVQGADQMLAVDRKTGTMGFGWFTGRQLAIAGDGAFVADGKSVACLDRAAYAEASRKRHEWESKAFQLVRKLRGQPPPNENELLQELNQAKRQITSLANVGVRWRTGTSLASSLIVTGNLVFVGGAGRVDAFGYATGENTWSVPVDGEARGLAVADGRLFVSTTTGKIHAFSSSPGVRSKSNLAVAGAPYPKDEWTDVYTAAATKILASTGVMRGFCLVVGGEEGRLAAELARRSDLKIYAVEPDLQKVQKARQALALAGLYGTRVTVLHDELTAIPFSNYFANLIVSDTLLRTGKLPVSPDRWIRHLKPMGGVACVGRSATPGAPEESPALLAEQFKATSVASEGTISTNGAWTYFKRGALPGAGNWTHTYGDAGNTASSEDRRVKGGLGVLWFGDPGPGKMVNRHDGAVGPLAIDGRLIVQGENSVMAYDAYNGLFLWEMNDSDAIRTGVYQNQNPGNLAAGNDSIFVAIREKCLQLNAETGKLEAIHRLPSGKQAKSHQWGYVATQDGNLIGTATIRKEVLERMRRRGRATIDSTDAIFAIDSKTGRHRWIYEGGSISHHTVALGPNRIYFIDSTITSDQRAALLSQDKTDLKKLTGEAAKQAEERMKRVDARVAVALDAQTGKKLWARLIDVTDCSELGTGGGKLTLIYHDGVLLLCGANANGHYWKQFVAGEFAQRRLLALSATDGSVLWAKDANYRHRPIVVENKIIAEPWAFDLKSGKQQMREHPLTGESVPWSMIRPGHHCGMLTGCPNMLMFRSGYTGFFDLTADSGTQHFAGHRLGCWINAVPANGLVMIPEASAGCVCLFSIAATVVLEPRETNRAYTIVSAVGGKTPVKHVTLNLGAPGDRRDDQGKLWLASPRPRISKETGLDLIVDVKADFFQGGGYHALNPDSVRMKGSLTPWIYANSARGLKSLSVPLLGPSDPPTNYTVKLHFAETDPNIKPGDRVFDVKAQGITILKDFDVVATAQGLGKAVVRELVEVKVSKDLKLEFLPRQSAQNAATGPILNAVEITRSEARAGLH